MKSPFRQSTNRSTDGATASARSRPWLTFRRSSKILAGVGIFVLWLFTLAPTALGGPLSLIWVSGTSMEPGLRTGDISILVKQGSYNVGDVVAFNIPEGGTVIHRIVDVEDDAYAFRGDNRSHDDPWVLSSEDVRGQQILRVPKAATISGYLSHPYVLGLLVAALVILGMIGSDQGTSRLSRAGELPWGPSAKDDLPWLRPSIARYRRRRRASVALERYRTELDEFRQWPALPS